MSSTIETTEYYVMKRGSEYLESVWEEWYEDNNYSFTRDLSRAMIFHRYQFESNYGAPKYLWNESVGKSIDTVEEMCKYFEGEMIKVIKQVKWKEK